MLLTEKYRANERRANDVYETPAALIEAALSLVELHPHSILDIGAGDGRWGVQARRYWPNVFIAGVEKRTLPSPAKYDLWFNGTSFPECADDWWAPFDLVVGNPPYKDVEGIIRRAISLLNPSGTLLFLLPLRFLASQSRRDGLFREHPPQSVHVCSKRPSFSGDGRTNASEFALFLWSKPWKGTPALKWLKEVPSGK